MNTVITEATIVEFYTSHPDNSSIPAQSQIPHMVSQRVFHIVANKNNTSVTGLVTSKQFSIQYDDNGNI